MKNDTILDAIGMINEEAVLDAKNYKRPKRQNWFKRGTIAACLCIALAIGMLVTPNSDIITGPGLLTVTAYASSTSENIELFEEYNMQENITLPYEYGWAITTSVVPGLPLKFSVPEYSKATIEISVSGGQFISWEKSTGDTVRDTNVLGQSFVIPNNSTIYWQNYVKMQMQFNSLLMILRMWMSYCMTILQSLAMRLLEFTRQTMKTPFPDMLQIF